MRNENSTGRPLPGMLTAAVIACLLLAGCAAIRPAQMALPPALQSNVTVVPITGIGGGLRGSYEVAAYRGRFERSESRLALFDVYEKRDGGSRYTVEGGELESAIEADCAMQERSITISIVDFTAKPMAYRCAFRANGQAMPARFEIQEARTGLAGAFGRLERRGEVAVPRTILQIRSVHALEGSPLQLATPIGYVFERDGVAVGAIELNGTPRLFLPADADVELRRAVVIGAVALGVFWDPANSALGREAG
jgi:hypothetical protein